MTSKDIAPEIETSLKAVDRRVADRAEASRRARQAAVALEEWCALSQEDPTDVLAEVER